MQSLGGWRLGGRSKVGAQVVGLESAEGLGSGLGVVRGSKAFQKGGKEGCIGRASDPRWGWQTLWPQTRSCTALGNTGNCQGFKWPRAYMAKISEITAFRRKRILFIAQELDVVLLRARIYQKVGYL